MLWIERLFVLSVFLCSIVLCEHREDSKRQRRHFLALLGYVHGYRFGQEYALQIPQYIISPIVIVPEVSQQHSVNIQDATNDENCQESGGTIQDIVPAQITSDVKETTDKDEKLTEHINLNDEIENFTQNIPNSDLMNNCSENLEDALRRGLENEQRENKNITYINQIPLMDDTTIGTSKNVTGTIKNPMNSTTKIPTETTSRGPTVSNINPGISNITNKTSTDSTIAGPYPLANYDNGMINSLTLTTNQPAVENSQSLPPVSDNRWQNFTLRANLSNVMPDENINMTMMNEQQNNTVEQSLVTENGMRKPEGSGGSYPSAWYNNEAIDQLSITTNYYTNESPSQSYDRWGTPMNMLPSGFRPLAGLYYDGYLHTPVKKYGFVPGNYWNYG